MAPTQATCASWPEACARVCLLVVVAAACLPRLAAGAGGAGGYGLEEAVGRPSGGGAAEDPVGALRRRPAVGDLGEGAKSRRLSSFFAADRNCRGRERQWATCSGLPRCPQACVPKNCTFAAWGDWYSLGGCSGLCARQRSIAHNSNECGTPCTGSKIQTLQRSDCLPDTCKATDVDCKWAAWSAWSGCLDPTVSQSQRTRRISVTAVLNGVPCEGPWRQTRPCARVTKTNCELSEWSEWTECSASCGGGWKAQMRHVSKRAKHGGLACSGVTRRTLPCNVQPCRKEVKPCVVGDWEDWDGCDAKSRHQRYRKRAIIEPSQLGAGLCSHELSQTDGCTNDWSSPSPCHRISHWTEWSECSEPCDGQSSRTRHVDLSSSDPHCSLARSGSVPLKQVVPCKRQDCILGTGIQLSQWSEWNSCSAESCGIGSTTRSREVVEPGLPRHSIRLLSLEMVKACDAGKCVPTDCRWGAWEAWSVCSRSCGGGEMHRSRMVQDPPRHGGRPCAPEHKSEVTPCNAQTCTVCLDGTWGEWGRWSSCTATCDHGFQVRHRDVMQYPNSCGTPASGLEDEYRLCKLVPCQQPRDCEVTPWSEWSQCTATCIGIKERRRQIVSGAVGGGQACVGKSLKEISPCTLATADQVGPTCGPGLPRACLLSPWGSWSECCTAAGKGMRRRTREILVPNANNGPACEGSLSEVAECEVANPEDRCQDCRWGPWSAWGGCSTAGGQRYRHRSVEKMPNYCGAPCDAQAAKEVDSCPRPVAQVRYCAWSAWSGLSECTATCGSATKLRRRELQSLIDKPDPLADWMGAGDCVDQRGSLYTKYLTTMRSEEECQTLLKLLVSMKWVRGAQYHFDSRTCAVVVDQHTDPSGSTEPSLWQVGSHARVSGPASGAIARTNGAPNRTCWRLDAGALLVGDEHTPCAGSQIDMVPCDFVSCITCDAVDCRFGAWGPWSSPSCLQLCERRRSVERPDRCGGRQCAGTLVQTRPCPRDCSAQKQDCALSAWGSWYPAACGRDVHQRTRQRRIVQEASHGGLACSGSLREARACARPGPDVSPCKVSSWAEWTSCSRDCGGGFRTRSRRIASEAAGGEPCKAALEEMELCNVQPCGETPCRFSAWGKWSRCSGSRLRVRHRKVFQLPSSGGIRCSGALQEAQACSASVDCVVSPWTEWSECDERCGGQQQRHRQVVRNPEGGGRPCGQHLAETRGCNADTCYFSSCEVGEWADWGRCSATCGIGHQARRRDLVRLAVAEGMGCNASLAESRVCKGASGPCDTRDCIWGEWSDWAGCSCSCGGGQRSRDRRIDQVPSVAGRPCKAQDKEEIEPCNTQPCGGDHCVDGTWAEWGEWEACSRTCSNGTTWRVRKVRHEANECGKPPVGLSLQHASCNVDVPCQQSQDCALSMWGPWSACTRQCGGIARRSRFIGIALRGGGKPCEGALQQARPCDQGCAPEVEPSDCELGQWDTWSDCDKTCGRGQHRRERQMVKEGRHGGRGCNAALSQTAVCHMQPCEACRPVDCLWEAWEDWGACDKCDGQRKRFRHVEVQPSCHGRDCLAGASEEISNCTRRCHEQTFCMWAAWAPWSECSQTCGEGGRRSRDRHLQVFAERALAGNGSRAPQMLGEDELSDMAEKLSLLRIRAQGLEDQRFTHLLTSFAFGSLSFIAFVSLVQHFTCGSAVQRPYAYTAVAAMEPGPPGSARDMVPRD